MKVKLAFPLESLAGSTKSDARNCYQPWKNLCVLRRKSFKGTLPERGFIQAKNFSGICSAEWEKCTNEQKYGWADYAKWINAYYPENKRFFSAYSCFFRSNLFLCIYRDSDFIYDAPSRRIIQNVSCDQVIGNIVLDSYLEVWLKNLHLDYEFYVLVKTSIPSYGYLKAFRSCELSCIKNLPVDSSLVCYAGKSFYDTTFENTFRSFAANQYLYLELTYFDSFGNVALPQISSHKIQYNS